MNKTTLVTYLFIATIIASSEAQDFVNLDFESAKIVFVPGSVVEVATSNALPGWSAFSGTNQLSTVEYNDSGVPITMGLVGSNSLVIDGNFSASLGGNFSISQTALVPSGTESLLFDGVSFGQSSLLVSLGGQNLSYTAISTGTNAYGLSYYVYAADVSAFANQVETLTFSVSAFGAGIVDDIQFSPEAIPEPSTASLFFLGSGILFYVRKRRQFRS